MNAAIPDPTRHLVDGLNSDEAARRLASDGPNEIAAERPRTAMRIARGILAEPMFVLLLAAAVIYLLLGDLRESLVLVASIAVIAVITILQERRTEHALARLRDLSSPRALVIRNGAEQRIPGRDVVVGDVILLREGDRVAADAIVHSATSLSVDESILTGESLPADKQPISTEHSDASSRVSSGTLIVRGYGAGIVVATGGRSEIGKIGRALHTLTPEATPLFREVRHIVRVVAVAGLLLCAAIALLYALLRGDWLGGVLAGITVAMGVLPEEFPVVLTLFLAMGAWRISRVGVLSRRMPAVESIGA
ncbi:MAG TPA: HAD-IC family P-type ATPase, partial [Povalibacter sp.]